MVKKRKIILSSIMILIVLTSILLITFTRLNKYHETIIGLTDEEKIEDFEYLWDKLYSSYPFWNEVSESGIDKDAVYEEYKREIKKSNTDIEFMKEVQYFLKEFKGYGHLLALDGHMYNFYDNTFTLSKTELDDEEVNEMKPWYEALYNPISKHTYSLLDSSHKGFRSTKGLKEEYKEQKLNSGNKGQVNGENLEFDIIDDKNIAYIKVKTFRFDNIETDRLKLEKFFEKIREYPNLIIDITDNSGGSDKYWQELIVSPNLSEKKTSKRYYLIRQRDITTPFLEARFDENSIFPISTLPEFDGLNKENLSLFSHYVIDEETIHPSKKSNGFNGKVWVLTSPKVYSSSENFVMFCKNTGFATLVGTPTGGDGGVADPILFPLPNSGLIIRFSMFYGLNNDGTGNEANGTIPDITIHNDESPLERTILEIK
ncbi:S41 family peptidase [Dethiothermospora halolimnae]|uniref:S41 family peptidase n=1 Tax=Dethiothermospora halolimnae TaxID=3114390 RepID=UPI003CCBEA50